MTTTTTAEHATKKQKIDDDGLHFPMMILLICEEGNISTMFYRRAPPTHPDERALLRALLTKDSDSFEFAEAYVSGVFGFLYYHPSIAGAAKDDVDGANESGRSATGLPTWDVSNITREAWEMCEPDYIRVAKDTANAHVQMFVLRNWN